ncbi:MAG: DUF2281 domain-containing protein [Bacteroidota bacterium]
MTNIQIYTQLSTLPSELRKQVGDFIDFLKFKSRKELPSKRVAGLAKGMIKMSSDFDEPLDDFNEYMR